MTDFTRRSQRVLNLAAKIDLEERLIRFGISGDTRENLRLFKPTLLANIGNVTNRFYDNLNNFLETSTLLNKRNISMLKAKQMRYWIRLLSSHRGKDYVEESIMVGIVHYNARIPPHIYIASYSFFLSELFRVSGKANPGYDFQAIAISVSKMIMFDMSLVLNAYWMESLRFVEI
jgi:hypothetical protein